MYGVDIPELRRGAELPALSPWGWHAPGLGLYFEGAELLLGYDVADSAGIAVVQGMDLNSSYRDPPA